MNRSKRRGFTIIELLTVITIVVVVVLLAIVAPAIQEARSADRRNDCRAKLKLIGWALHNYHETHNCFAPGFVAVGTQKTDVGGFAWSTYLLVFMDQAPLYKNFNTNRNITDPENLTFVGTVLPAWKCPDDTGPSSVKLADGTAWGTTNYVGNFGVGTPRRLTLEGDDVGAKKIHGLFGHNSRLRIRDCRDGTTNIFMVGERRLPKMASDWKPGATSGPHASFWAGDPDIMNSEAQSILGSSAADSSTGVYGLAGRLCEGSNSGPNGSVFAATNPACSTTGTGANGNPILPNRKPGAAGELLKDDISLGYSSPHLGGVQILLVDGSVRFVSDSVNVATWVNLARRADGEVVGEF